jgi:hypothetical protein
MWVFTQHGFVSAVQHFDNQEQIVVRSRDKESLALASAFFETKVISSPSNDYPFRIVLSRDQFAEFIQTEVAMLDYTNFKSRLDVSRGEHWHDTASQVWSIMHDIEDADARKRKPVAQV